MRCKVSLSNATMILMPILLLVTACTIVQDQQKPKQETPPIQYSLTPTNRSARLPTTTPYSTITAIFSTATQAPIIPSKTSSPVSATATSNPWIHAKGSIVMAGIMQYGMGIYLYNLENNSLDNLTLKPGTVDVGLYFNPSWSPDGSQIVYSYGKEKINLFLYRFSTKSIEEILWRQSCDDIMETAWSPDGKSIVFTACGHMDLYSVRNKTVKQITYAPYPDFALQPAWSPNGKEIAFLGNNGQEKDNVRIFIIDINGQNRKAIAPNVSIGWGKISWSPDGQSIAFRSKEGCGDICTVNINSGAVQCLTHTPYGETDPDWSPDGRFIAYVATDETRLCDQSHGEPLVLGWQLHIIDIGSGQDKALTNTPRATFTSPDWLP